ncbi:hypothetical protein [Shewanella colwelliana]|uniref:hypothetical protein n=1 Tax=Shewanella colwelliana TaxID=23 RepID=UPI003734E5EE
MKIKITSAVIISILFTQTAFAKDLFEEPVKSSISEFLGKLNITPIILALAVVALIIGYCLKK